MNNNIHPDDLPDTRNAKQRLQDLLKKNEWDRIQVFFMLLNEFEQYIEYVKNDPEQQQRETYEEDLQFLDNLGEIISAMLDVEDEVSHPNPKDRFVKSLSDILLG
jgi:biotin-(acetyl-CoA carboxylase) ligase